MNWINAGGVDWHVEWHGHRENNLLVMVHGFAGSLRTWQKLGPELTRHFRLMLIDLPGHGDTPLPEAPKFALRDLWEAFGKLLLETCSEPPLVCGYSMGGRIALQYGVHAANLLRGLILIGASPGIANEHEREQRRLNDHHLAENILTKGTEWFADYWAELPLFATQKYLLDSVQAELRRTRLACDPRGLAYALERFGTGNQEFLGDQLRKLRCPLLLMAGEMDSKFCASNRYIAASSSSVNVHRLEILEAGHAVHIEQPAAVVREIITFSEII